MHNEAVTQIIFKTIKPQIMNMDPFNIEKIEEKVILKNYKISGQLLAMAFSGVEIALWDIKGKFLKQPIYNLLGGKYRDKVYFYGSSISRNLNPDEEAEKLREGIQTFGFQAIKFKIGPRMGTGLSVNLDKDEEKVREIREGIGADIHMMVDANSSYTYIQAVQCYERIKAYRIFHFEEPCPYYDIEAYVKLM